MIYYAIPYHHIPYYAMIDYDIKLSAMYVSGGVTYLTLLVYRMRIGHMQTRVWSRRVSSRMPWKHLRMANWTAETFEFRFGSVQFVICTCFGGIMLERRLLQTRFLLRRSTRTAGAARRQRETLYSKGEIPYYSKGKSLIHSKGRIPDPKWKTLIIPKGTPSFQRGTPLSQRKITYSKGNSLIPKGNPL